MKVYVFHIDFGLIADTRVIKDEKINHILSLNDLPKDVHALLRQKIMPKEPINAVAKHKNRAQADLYRHATRDPMLGWIIDPTKKAFLVEAMEAHRNNFYAAKAAMLAELPSILSGHADRLREACDAAGYTHTELLIQAVRDAQPSAAYLEQQLRFEFLQPKLIEIDVAEADIVREGVYGSALHEIAERAKRSAAQISIASRLRALDEIREKLDGLSYIERRLGRIANEILLLLREVPRGLPEKEYTLIHGMAMTHLLSLISDEERLAQRVASGEVLFQVGGDLGALTPNLFEDGTKPASASTAPVSPVVVPIKATVPPESKPEQVAATAYAW